MSTKTITIDEKGLRELLRRMVNAASLDAAANIADHAVVDRMADTPAWRETWPTPVTPGTTGTATVRGIAGIRVFRLDPAPYEPGEHFAWATPDCRMGLPANEASWLLFEDDVTDFVPDEAALPTEDDLVEALKVTAHVRNASPSHRDDARAILAHLRAVQA